MKNDTMRLLAKRLAEKDDFLIHLFQYYVERFKGKPPIDTLSLANIYIDDLMRVLQFVKETIDEGEGGEKNAKNKKGKQS